MYMYENTVQCNTCVNSFLYFNFCKNIAIKYVSNNRTKIITVFSCMHQIIISTCIWYLGLLITFYTTTT